MLADEANLRLLSNAIAEGDVVLLLGAGASATSTVRGSQVKLASQLARVLAEKGGLTYEGENLAEVLGAVKGRRLSEKQIFDVLQAEYTKVDPSPELSDLFQYSWRRVYTWNIDDSIENCRGGVQRRRFFNGMIDKVSVHEGLAFLQVVHLHGEAIKPEHGFIFSTSEYNARLNRNDHDWYRAAADDYIAHVPLFIGSRLNEPILSAELDRSRPNPDAGLGMAFLITPDNFSSVQRENLASRNIIVLEGTLDTFVEWLRSTSGPITPLEVAKRVNAFAEELGSRYSITPRDIETAQSIIVRKWADANREGERLKGAALRGEARTFLEGAPPTWKLAATQIPVWLQGTDDLYNAALESIEKQDRFFSVYGQSGSGKTTALYQVLLRISRERNNQPFYEIRGDVKSLRSALTLLHQLHKERHLIVYIGDAHLYGDPLVDDALTLPHGAMTLVTAARSGEWKEHIARRIGQHGSSFEFQRFVEADYDPLISRLIEYVPSPIFRRMNEAERYSKLKQSKSQLLIALKETTHSQNFTNIITDEFKKLPDDDCRKLVVLVGLATLARSGLAAGALREAYSRVANKRSFDDALLALEGIVLFDHKSRRYAARHELYVRHLVEGVNPLEHTLDCIIELLRTFTKYELPIVKTVGRQDSLLFKFLLNHNFTSDLCEHHSSLSEGLRIYETFEVDFQLDGHFWLQYGQYFVVMDRLEDALVVLRRSIQAFPNNSYATHAFADVQLRVAARRLNFDPITVAMIDEAVKALETNLASAQRTDQYPLVTLAERHVGALIRHGQLVQARAAASKYFRRVEDASRRNSSESLQRARERLAHFLTFGTW